MILYADTSTLVKKIVDEGLLAWPEEIGMYIP
jgi:hypothetical protein